MTEWTKGNEKQERDDETDLGGTMRVGAYPAHLVAVAALLTFMARLRFQSVIVTVGK